MIHRLYRDLRSFWFSVKEWIFLRTHSSRAERFAAIYRKRIWQNPESASGFGSTLEATRSLREGLNALLAREAVTSVLDAPCGDFNWQQDLVFGGQYLGLEIVPELVDANCADYASDHRQFRVADIVHDTLPGADLVLCRECLNHLPLTDADRAIEHLSAAAGRFLLLTHYPCCDHNAEQEASFRYRHLNLTLPPFNLRSPDEFIDESAFEMGKQVAIWRMDGRSLRTVHGDHA